MTEEALARLERALSSLRPCRPHVSPELLRAVRAAGEHPTAPVLGIRTATGRPDWAVWVAQWERVGAAGRAAGQALGELVKRWQAAEAAWVQDDVRRPMKLLGNSDLTPHRTVGSVPVVSPTTQSRTDPEGEDPDARHLTTP